MRAHVFLAGEEEISSKKLLQQLKVCTQTNLP
jgi:hypothetical protein